MILIRSDIELGSSQSSIESIEQIYLHLNKLRASCFAQVYEESVYIICEDQDDYFKICMELILVLNKLNLNAKLYISHSNEVIDLNSLEIATTSYQIFKLNEAARKQYLKTRSFKRNEHYLIRAHHPMLDSILYSLSQMCFKHNQNIELLYDKYYNRLTQSQVAERHGLSQVAVSKKLKSNNYEMFKLLVSRL
ncbi:hypothetical protein R2F61_03025 [Mollicutes bacterium LVI A0078]|nr:hypothetical protein RZE84_03055 [Mollicutes bacterium LVI A0075]WOO91538.1 hypothetical protein R2F61_03025 [Mollicutes bacterium LVI A0078]